MKLKSQPDKIPLQGKLKKKEFEPNYIISPMETLADFCLDATFGSDLIVRFEKEGITENNVYLITAMFPRVPKAFWLNLQKNYDKDKKRLNL